MSNLKLYNEFKKYFVSYSQSKTQSFPQRMIRSLKEVAPDKIFEFNKKPLILYFKITKELTKDEIFRRYWNFAEAPIIFIETDSEIEIYNGFEYILENGKPAPLELNTDNLNYYSLISGEYFNNNTFKSSNRRLDTTLLQNIKDARALLIEILDCANSDNIANALLGRILFIRYLIDRKIELYYNNKKQIVTNSDLKDILSDKKRTYQFFKDLQSNSRGFNGDWFPINEEEEKSVQQEHLSILRELISGTEIKTGQRSLFDYYDFSIIPIEFISNVYEHFIGEEKQKKDGAYYTPTFLVDYVLKYTVDDYFKNNPNKYNCKILDPACGSGIFLVEAFRKIVAQYEKVMGKKVDKKVIKKLVKDNIFGIDYNKNALQISIFSLYLAMLDYQEPKDIENFKFPYLTRDNPNFFNSDFFDTQAEFNKILKEKKIDFIIGNPPYGRSTIKAKSFADTYIKKEKISIGAKDIVQPFMIRVKDFSSDNTEVSFIITSKVFYNLKTDKFREQFLSQFKIKHILELSSVRKQIFENANTPVSIIFYKYSSKNEVLKNTIKYISMKPSPYFEKLKLLLISKSDFKKVSQAKLLEYDYLWKILVYGSYLDFHFIKRLKANTILKKIEKNKYPNGMGIQATKGKYNISSYLGKPFIDIPRGKQSDRYMTDFYIRKDLLNWKIKKVHRRGERELFKKYSVLIKRGINTDTLRAKSAILYKEAVFKHTLTGVNVPTKQEAQLFLGLIGSSLFAYFNLEHASSIGIEREQLHDTEKLQAPYIKNNNIIKQVNKIEKLQKEHFDTNNKDILNYNNRYKMLLKELDKAVLDAFNLTEQEYALIDYATNIVIPWVIQKKYNIAFTQYDYKDSRIEEYVNIFIKHYTKLYKPNNLYFQATIHWSKYAIGIYFRVLKDKPKSLVVWKKEENIETFLKLMQGKSLENLFIQKDIKGFEAYGFYVVKPNEIKNWHKAIGYLDFYEFKKAILRAGRANGNI